MRVRERDIEKQREREVPLFRSSTALGYHTFLRLTVSLPILLVPKITGASPENSGA